MSSDDVVAVDGSVGDVVVEAQRAGQISDKLYVILNPKNGDGDPLMVDGKPVKRLELRKPKPVELAGAGINLQDVSQSNIATTLELLKIQCEPYLGTAVYDLDLPVLTEAAAVNLDFFMGSR